MFQCLSAIFSFYSSFFFRPPSNCKCITGQHCQSLVQCMRHGACGRVEATGSIWYSTHGWKAAGEWLSWAITASVRQHRILLLFWHRSSGGSFSQWICIDFPRSCRQIVCGSNCDHCFSHLLPDALLSISLSSYLDWAKLNKGQGA